MAWWAWLLVFVALVLLSLGVFFLLLRSLWRKAMALMEDLGAAAEKLDLLTEHLDRLDDASAAPAEPAVFASPTRLRQQRFQRR